jgi:hypothetical protein
VLPGFPGIIPTPSTGQGVLISEWKPDFPQVYPGEQVTFYSKVKNAGSFMARNVFFEVTDLDSWSDVKPSSIDCGSGSVNLIAPNAQYGTEGEEKDCAWTATSPNIETGLHMTYRPLLTVCYDYVSRTVLRTPSVSRYELKRLQDSGSGLLSQTMISGSGPVTISASTPSPIIVTDAKVTFPVKISVVNNGNGMVCIASGQRSCTGSGKMNMVGLEVESQTAAVVECPDELGLWRNSGEITCDMMMQSDTPTLLQNDVEITASYRYCIDATTSIEVRSR